MEAGQLTEAVRRKPYSVVLFDEIEKANKSILNLLLQVLDDGHLTDAQGLTVDFRNTVIIMTSNLGADAMLSGFLEKCTMNQADNQVMQKVKEHFSPELLNRVDEKIVFRHLSGEQLREVVNSQLKDVVSRCADRGIELNVTAAAIDYINAKINDPVSLLLLDFNHNGWLIIPTGFGFYYCCYVCR
jgi:ATP-dependent Clp protease ATP-binding subunit ClpB